MREIKWRKLHVEKEHGMEHSNENMIMIPNMNTFEVFNKDRFWVGDLNFKITRAEFEYLNFIEGIETANYVSPYKIIVLIGELFDEEKTKQQIVNEFCNKEPEAINNEDDESVFLNKDFVQKLQEVQDFTNWVVYLIPNGKIISETSEEDIDVSRYHEAYELVGGALLTSYDFRANI